MNLYDIPNDILIEILAYLNLRSIIRMARIDTKFRTLVETKSWDHEFGLRPN